VPAGSVTQAATVSPISGTSALNMDSIASTPVMSRLGITAVAAQQQGEMR